MAFKQSLNYLQDHGARPWVLPVYVLSSQRNESRHLVPKEARCTIDTGNLVGNIVSKEFVTTVLGFPESSFQRLTELEKAGGTGVAGHKFIPEGVIYLTWYHRNSTRVFREMRFLISEHPMFDLIISFRSVPQNKILDRPDLMAKFVVWNEKIDGMFPHPAHSCSHQLIINS
jgi:hypothetical protein